MNKNQEKMNAQKKLASMFFEMGMDEDVICTVTGLNKEETSKIKNKQNKKQNIDLKK